MQTFFVRFVMTYALVAMASTARAESSDPGPLEVSAEAEYLTGNLASTEMKRGGVGAVIRYDLTYRLSLYAALRASYLQLDFTHYPLEGLATDGRIVTPFEPTGRVGASYAPLSGAHHRLTVIAEFEMSLPGVEPEITRLNMTTPDGTFDISGFGSDSVHPALFWKRFSIGTDLKLRVGRWEPSFGVAFEAISAAIDLRMSEDGGATVRQLGFDSARIERRYTESQLIWIIPLRPGLGYRLDQNVVRLGGLVAPGGTLFGVDLAYTRSW